jgi:hypothetical protein
MARSIRANDRYNSFAFEGETADRAPRARREKVAQLNSKRMARSSLKHERERLAKEIL